jgi:hypothetical protein
MEKVYFDIDELSEEVLFMKKRFKVDFTIDGKGGVLEIEASGGFGTPWELEIIEFESVDEEIPDAWLDDGALHEAIDEWYHSGDRSKPIEVELNDKDN